MVCVEKLYQLLLVVFLLLKIKRVAVFVAAVLVTPLQCRQR